MRSTFIVEHHEMSMSSRFLRSRHCLRREGAGFIYPEKNGIHCSEAQSDGEENLGGGFIKSLHQ